MSNTERSGLAFRGSRGRGNAGMIARFLKTEGQPGDVVADKRRLFHSAVVVDGGGFLMVWNGPEIRRVPSRRQKGLRGPSLMAMPAQTMLHVGAVKRRLCEGFPDGLGFSSASHLAMLSAS